MRLVLKRDGRVEPWDSLKLRKAVKNAYIDAGLPDTEVCDLTDLKLPDSDPLPVAEIDTAVQVRLLQLGVADVALAYSLHRKASEDKARLAQEKMLAARAAGDDTEVVRLLRLKIVGEAAEVLGEPLDPTSASYYIRYLQHGVKVQAIDPRVLVGFASSLLPTLTKGIELDLLGLTTLYDRYLLKDPKTRKVYETPEALFFRVAAGLTINEHEATRTDTTLQFLRTMLNKRYMPSTPTLFNAGTLRPQLSSCYLTTVEDSIEGIYGLYKDNAHLSKYAGGLGNDWTPIRSAGSHIAGTNGESQGVVPFLKVQNDSCVAVNQGGKRRGAACAYLEVWHGDILAFLELRKNTGEERRRCHDLNTAVWVPDLFMERVEAKSHWTLFDPASEPRLHETYGEEFVKLYTELEDKGLGTRIQAVDLWRKILGSLFETGHPWITFKDRCNEENPQKHCGVIHSSNLCTEITLNTSKDEIAVCNLGSVNLTKFVDATGQLDGEALNETVATAIHMLDNVIDLNFYPVGKAKTANLRHRPVGLGVMGFQDVLHNAGIPYESQRACTLAGLLQCHIHRAAVAKSTALAEAKGAYSSYWGSTWSKGITKVIDEEINQHIRLHGMRNSNLTAIAPTATISNICGVSQSIEPAYQNVYVKSNLSGEFTVVNKYLKRDLEKLGLWSKEMQRDIASHDGSIQHIAEIPATLKDVYKTAFELDPMKLIDCAAARQKYIDQSQSFNVYMAEPSGKKLHDVYMACWKKGLKTTYYLRSKAK